MPWSVIRARCSGGMGIALGRDGRCGEFALVAVAPIEFVIEGIEDFPFLERPGWADEEIGGAVTGESVDDHFGGENLELVADGVHVVVFGHEFEKTVFVLFDHGGVFEEVEEVYFDALDVELGDGLGGLQHHVAGLLGEAVNDVGADADVVTP